MTGPAPALGPDLACRDFLSACAAMAPAEERARALRPGLPHSVFVPEETRAVLEALATAFRPDRPLAPAARTADLEEILRSRAAQRALAFFAEAPRFAELPGPALEAEGRVLSAFPDNTPERIARMVDKKRGAERKALGAFLRKHGADARRFAEMGAAARREYLWMWAQSAFLAKRRFVRAAEAWVRACS